MAWGCWLKHHEADCTEHPECYKTDRSPVHTTSLNRDATYVDLPPTTFHLGTPFPAAQSRVVPPFWGNRQLLRKSGENLEFLRNPAISGVNPVNPSNPGNSGNPSNPAVKARWGVIGIAGFPDFLFKPEDGSSAQPLAVCR